MTRRLLAAAAAVTCAVLPGTAQALPVSGACTAKAYQPTWESTYYATGRGSMTCTAFRSWVSVEVCLEVLAENGWEGVGCGTGIEYNADAAWAEAYGCKFGTYLTRTIAVGWSSAGERADAASLPVVGYCTPI